MNKRILFGGTFDIAGFAFQSGDSDREMQALALFANANQIPRRFFRKVTEIPQDWIACGSTEWVGAALGRNIRPDYYPLWLESWMHRRVWCSNTWPEPGVFVKPADRYKRFTGFVVPNTASGRRRGPFWCSETVSFCNEWRYYVSDGKVLAAYWYAGVEEEKPAPIINVEWPPGFCGAVDFGQLLDGRIALVEAQHPFACGWYGRLSEGAIYAEWIVSGWEFMKSEMGT